MTFPSFSSDQSLGARLALPHDWRLLLQPLSAAWLGHSEFSLNSLLDSVSVTPQVDEDGPPHQGTDPL